VGRVSLIGITFDTTLVLWIATIISIPAPLPGFWIEGRSAATSATREPDQRGRGDPAGMRLIDGQHTSRAMSAVAVRLMRRFPLARPLAVRDFQLLWVGESSP